MSTQQEQASLFARLHVKGQPLILYNVWDAGSARTVEEAGARALATGSWAVAAAHGYADGEALPLELALANLRRIVASVSVPVSLDFESGYAQSPEALNATVAQAIAAGAIGINLEDQQIERGGLYGIEEQQARLRAAHQAGKQAGLALFINARTDIFLKKPRAEHSQRDLDEALQRAVAYEEAGASGFFAPGLVDEGMIEALCAGTALPVNIMMTGGAPAPSRLAALGVARISYGGGSYRTAMQALREGARQAFELT